MIISPDDLVFAYGPDWSSEIAKDAWQDTAHICRMLNKQWTPGLNT